MPELTRWVIYPDAAEKVTDTPEMQSLLEQVCHDALNAAYAAAPVHSGNYRESLFARGKEGGEEQKHPFAMLGSSSFYWHWIEYGSINNEPLHVLGESVKSVVEVYVEL